MPRIVDYCSAPVQKRRVSITDQMADDVREILGRDMTAEQIALEFDEDEEVQEVLRELIAEEVEEEPYPGWAMGLGISEADWSDHYEAVDRAVRVKRKFAAKRAAAAAEYAKTIEKIDMQERKMMPVWNPKSKLIREITNLVYKGLSSDERDRLDVALGDLKEKIKELNVEGNPRRLSTGEKHGSSSIEFVEDIADEHVLSNPVGAM